MAEAKVNIAVNVGGNAAAQFQNMAKAASDAAKAGRGNGSGANRGGYGGGGNGYGNGGRGNGGGGNNGGNGGGGSGGVPWGKFAGAAAVAVIALNKALDKTTKAIEITNDSYATAAQKARALGAEFVPFGEKLMKLEDAVTGVTDAMARQKERFEIAQAQDAVRFGYGAKIAATGQEHFAYQASARAADAIKLGGYSTFDRSTLSGERAAERQDLTIGAKDELVRAQREAMAAREGAEFANKGVGESHARVAAQQAAADRADAALRAAQDSENGRGPGKKIKGTDWSSPGSVIKSTDWSKPSTAFISLTGGGTDKTPTRDKAGMDSAGRNALLESSRLSRELEARESAITRAKEAGLKAAEAESRVRKAQIEVAKAELAVLQQQEARMRGMAQGVGAMSQGERIAAVNALKSYQANGGEAPPEIEALVAKLAPDMVRKNQERRGADFIQNDVRGALSADEFKGAFGGDFAPGATLKEVMAKVDKVKADIRVDIDIDATSTAKQLAELLKPVLENLQAAFKIEIQNVEKRIRAGTAITRNAAGP